MTKRKLSSSRPAVAESLEKEALRVASIGELRRLVFAKTKAQPAAWWETSSVEAAYESCRKVTEENSKTFFLASQFLAPKEQTAIWAIYNWCRVTDEMVDGDKADATTMADLQAWQDELHKTFAFDRAVKDKNSLALMDAIREFSLLEKPFEDMIAGMAMDLTMKRYETFRELEVYCYRVAGTVGLMSLPVIGLDPRMNSNVREKETTISAAMSLGMALQLTNILRDIGEDARRGRIYVPLQDLERFGISEDEILEASGTTGLLFHEQRWADFMEFQIERCHKYYRLAEAGIVGLNEANQLGVMAALYVYEAILEKIRQNNYDNLSQRGFVSSAEKAMHVARALFRLWELRTEARPFEEQQPMVQRGFLT